MGRLRESPRQLPAASRRMISKTALVFPHHRKDPLIILLIIERWRMYNERNHSYKINHSRYNGMSTPGHTWIRRNGYPSHVCVVCMSRHQTSDNTRGDGESTYFKMSFKSNVAAWLSLYPVSSSVSIFCSLTSSTACGKFSSRAWSVGHYLA